MVLIKGEGSRKMATNGVQGPIPTILHHWLWWGGLAWGLTAHTQHCSSSPSTPVVLDWCLHLTFHCLDSSAYWEDPKERGAWESTDHGFLKFYSRQVFDKIAMFGLKNTSLIWHTHNWGLIKDFLFLSQFLRHFSLTEVGKQSLVVMGNSRLGVKTVL